LGLTLGLPDPGAGLSADELEVRAAGTWRAPAGGRIGDWLLRAAEGFTGRANSVLAVGDPGVPLAAALEQARAWYAARGLPPMIAVPFPVSGPQGSGLDTALGARGWTLRGGPAIVMTAAPALIAGRAAAAPPVSLSASPDDEWLAMYHYRGQRLPPVARRLLTSAPWQAFATIREAGQVIAIGRVAGDAGWAGLTAIETHPEHRRRGLGAAVTAALAGAGAAAGYAGLFLQVESGNEAARTLYASLGFTHHHRYHYRLPPPT
jgi:ribosomal protein S18 acetylase RimI-like enzyme